MFATIIFIVLFIVFILTLIVTTNGFTVPERILAIFVACAADIVALMELAGIFEVFNSVYFLLLIQTLITFAAVFITCRIGYKISDLKIEVQKFLASIKKGVSNPGVIPWISLLIISIFYLGLAYLTIRFPQNISDTLYNHLSRIGFWIQQGSLKHYNGFSVFGMVYPYNSGLLLSLPVIFLKTDRFAGLVQFFSAIFGAIAIYNISVNLGFKKRGSIIAGLVFLTYPVIIFESITAQNDLLVACFISIAFAFLILFRNKDRFIYLFLSCFSIGLGIGTKQTGFLILPGYVLFLLYTLIIQKKESWRIIPKIASLLVISILLFGSYSYIQNLVDYGNFIGPKGFLEDMAGISQPGSFAERFSINSTRLFSQFISCDGLPPPIENHCVALKTTILKPILGNAIESNQYLNDNSDRFSLSIGNFQNAESAWFGLVSWILIIPAIFLAIFDGIRKRSFDRILIILTAILFFFEISVVQKGWSPFQGRYLITAVMLLQPFISGILEPKRKLRHFVEALICILSIGILIYSIISNANLPLVSKKQVRDVYVWGETHSRLVLKVAVKIDPSIRYNNDVWNMNVEEIRTLSDHSFLPALNLVEKNVESGSSIGIVANSNMFPDYLFRGPQVRNKLFSLSEHNLVAVTEEFLLMPVGIDASPLYPFSAIGSAGDWILYKKK